MPNSKKDALQEFFNSHIQGAQFFDLDKIKVSLNKNQYIEKSEWFFHRFFNLLIFKINYT